MADFYIRSWDPASTYPSNPHEGDVCYTITLDQSWAPVAGVKNDNLLKTEIYTNGEWVEQGGGGGGGGGRTATVELTTTVTGPTNINNFYIFGGDTSNPIISSPSITSGTYLVPLSEGGAYWAVDNEYTISTTGDIEFDGDGFMITGDGTITVADA